MGSPYIKKEDALDFFKNYLRGQIIIGVFYTIISFFLILFFSREINSLSNQINSADIYLYTGTLLMILGTIAYWVFIAKSFSKSFKDDFFNKIKQYDNKEMLNWSKLIDLRKYWLGVGLYILGIALGILFYILPILK
jgi:hypothetical protein